MEEIVIYDMLLNGEIIPNDFAYLFIFIIAVSFFIGWLIYKIITGGER